MEQRKGELVVGWRNGQVYLTNIEESTCLFTPDDAERLAKLLTESAEKARRVQ